MELTQDNINQILIEISNAGIEIPEEDIQAAVKPLVFDLRKDTDAALKLIETLREEIKAASKPSTITVTLKVGSKRKIVNRDFGVQHQRFVELLNLAQVRTESGSRLNIWIAGPAGTGKTTAAANIAKALNLPFFFNGAIDSEHKLLGFTDANGKIVSRPFRKCYQNGGVYLFDEVDASLPAAVLAFNAALANGQCDFPDGTIDRHVNCVIIAAANTTGHGATPEYVGRLKQDAAFLDRFAFLEWPIDEKLELYVAEQAEQKAWCLEVQRYRANAKRHGLRNVVITPRATFLGAALLNHTDESGKLLFTKEFVIESSVRKGLAEDTWQKVARN